MAPGVQGSLVFLVYLAKQMHLLFVMSPAFIREESKTNLLIG